MENNIADYMETGIYVEADFIYKNHRCLVCFNRVGYRTGYVSCKEETDYDFIECHGGITFEDSSLPCFIDKDDKFEKFIGFDCNYYFDGIDYNYLGKGIEIHNFEVVNSYYNCHDLLFCIKECYNIVDQLVEKEKSVDNYNDLEKFILKSFNETSLKSISLNENLKLSDINRVMKKFNLNSIIIEYSKNDDCLKLMNLMDKISHSFNY